MTTDWKKIRDDFPVTKTHAYFLSAAMSPLPVSVFEALAGEYRKVMLDGDIHYEEDLRKCDALSSDLAGLLGTKADNMAFVANTSTAMSLIALAFQDRVPKPFNVVSLEDEFPASTLGFEHRGIEMRYVRAVKARYPPDSIIAAANRETLAVVASFVQYATGFRLDLEALGRGLKDRGILFVVNATQGFPYFPLDVKAMNIDALSCSFHKWGLTGHVGAMFYTAAAFRARFPSPSAGWLSVIGEGEDSIHTAKNVPFRLHPTAKQYMSGTYNLQPLLAFRVALDYMKRIGFENIRQRLFELTDCLIAGLGRLGIRIVSPIDRLEERSAIVAFSLDEASGRCVEVLATQNIHVSLRTGLIRVSLNIFNDEGDIDRLLEAVENFRSNRS
jgi:selenocysteine lyase/cysteine desulfurase